MKDNRSLIQKADSDLAHIAAGGLLVTQQADRFIQLLINEAVMLPDILVTPMNGPVEELDKSRFDARVLRAGAEGAALPFASRVRADLSTTTLTAQLYKAQSSITDEALEDQIERGSFRDTIMSQLSQAVARDIELAAVQSDTTSADAMLAQQDGWLVLATSNTTNAAGAALSKTLLRNTYQFLPDEWARSDRLAFYTNRFARISYRDSLADRATALGDAMLQASDRTVYMDIPVKASPQFPVVGGNTQVLLTDPKNLVIGFWRKIRMELDRDAQAGLTHMIVTVRFAIQIVEIDAVARTFAVDGA